MRRIATKEDTLVTEAVGNHAPPCPILLSQDVEREFGVHAKDVPNAAEPVHRRRALTRP